MTMFTYRGWVTRVIDGDTFEANIDLGFRVQIRETFRVYDYDAPETWRPKSEAEREHGQQAKSRVEGLLEDHEVVIRTHKTGKYGRWLAEVEMPGGQDLATLLKAEGLEKRETYETITTGYTVQGLPGGGD